jgi:predicted transcriptional regulator
VKGITDPLKKRLEELADRERRGRNQQAILLLERALAEEPTGFERAYRQFRDRHGPSPLRESDLSGLRSDEEGRVVDL